MLAAFSYVHSYKSMGSLSMRGKSIDRLIILMYILRILRNKMANLSDWQELIQLTQGQPIIIERVRLSEKDIAIEGAFEVPQLARLTQEDQVFITAFIRSHGSIKEMEQTFGVSYPTIKSRLNRIAGSLEYIDVNPAPSRTEILDRLSRGEMTADEAIRQLQSIA